jgi:hypothetical protein
MSTWAMRGFSSYRLEAESLHLHCSGLSLEEGCEWTSLNGRDDWTALQVEEGPREAAMWQASNWVEFIGYAVMLSALGAGSVKESCSNRAFLYRSHHDEPVTPEEQFVSFVMDL